LVLIFALTFIAKSRELTGDHPQLFNGKRSAPGMIVILLVGVAAGYLAGEIARGSCPWLIGDAAIGIVGPLIGNWLLPSLWRSPRRRIGVAGPRLCDLESLIGDQETPTPLGGWMVALPV
jgi:uncharacterized membrane protein YeaQ/YmgE (transglycosylase-associated protein family)